ncbi:hypothetical protein TNCV_221421 [Trichonephila clavipes]|nr:hypothetical protein TNCV_221421 [Trichonephila clavipes]
MGTAVTATSFAGMIQHYSLKQNNHRIRNSVFKRSSRFLSLGPWGVAASANSIACVRRREKNSDGPRHLSSQPLKTQEASPPTPIISDWQGRWICTLHSSFLAQLLWFFEMNVTISHRAYGGSINRLVNSYLSSWTLQGYTATGLHSFSFK